MRVDQAFRPTKFRAGTMAPRDMAFVKEIKDVVSNNMDCALTYLDTCFV